jgi:putative membrane protein
MATAGFSEGWAPGILGRSSERRAMLLDLLLACLHHVAVFAVVAILAVEIVLLRPGLDRAAIQRLARIDLWFGVMAALALAAGFARVFFGLKGPDYYFANHVFWTKVGLFLFIGVLSIWPTLKMLGWRRALARNPDALPSPGEVRGARRVAHVEAGLVILLPLLGAAMARGYGLSP